MTDLFMLRAELFLVKRTGSSTNCHGTREVAGHGYVTDNWRQQNSTGYLLIRLKLYRDNKMSRKKSLTIVPDLSAFSSVQSPALVRAV
jgi:hypothetical protein